MRAEVDKDMNVQTFDPVALEAYVQLLARPDPGDLPHRGHVCRCKGDPDRRSTRLPRIVMAWFQRRHLATDIAEPLASATRLRRERPANPGLHVLRLTCAG